MEKKSFIFQAKLCPLNEKASARETVRKKSGACDYWMRAVWGPHRAAPRRPRERDITLNSNRPVSGADSGIVDRPDRVRRGNGGRRVGNRARLLSGSLPPVGGGRKCGGGRVGIGRFSWGADAQYADV